MISRLLLVGMVGVLGISLPDGAKWGPGLTWARAGTTADTGRRDVVAFEPIPVVEDPTNRIADELNRRSQGLDLPAEPTVSVASRSWEDFAPVVSNDSIELKILVDFCRVRAEAEGRATNPARSIRRPVEAESDRIIDGLFAENRVWSDPAVEEIESSISPARGTQPSLEPITVAETASKIADELNHASEGIDGAPARAAVLTVQRVPLEPIAVADDAPSLADELNLVSEGQFVAPDADRGIGNAIRLTRNAALAWMNVLTKTMPAMSTSR